VFYAIWSDPTLYKQIQDMGGGRLRYSDNVPKQHEPKDGQRRNGVIFFIAIASLYAGGMFFLLRQAKLHENTVIAMDLAGIVLIPLLFYFLCTKPASRPKEFIYVIFVATLGLLYWLTPAEQRSFLQSVLSWIIPVVESIMIPYVIYRIYTIVKRYKAAGRKEEQHPMDIMREALLPFLGKGVVLEIVLAEMSVFYYSLIVWFKKPQLTELKFFTYHKDSQIKMMVIVFTILIIVETVGLHFLLRIWSDLLAWVSVVLNIYGILYMIAFKNSVRYLPHLLNDQYLLIRLGFQSSVVVHLNNIESIAKAKPFDLLEKIPKDTYLSYMRLDTPQFEIRLKQPTQMKGSYGMNKEISTIVLRVDNPNEFEAELKRLRE